MNYRHIATSSPTTPHVIEDTRHTKAAPVKRVKPRRRPMLAATCVLVALACLVLLVADLLVPNGIADYVVTAFAKQPQCAYAVCLGQYDTLDAARAAATVSREMGGAGFVAYDGKYNVLLAAYVTQQEAQAVAEKGGYTLFPLYIDCLQEKDFPLAVRGKVKPLVDYPVQLFEQLCQWTTQLAQHGTTVAYVQQRLQAVRDALYQNAHEFLTATAQTTDATTLNYRSVLSGALAALDNLCAHSDGEALFLADLRWTAIMVLRANRR